MFPLIIVTQIDIICDLTREKTSRVFHSKVIGDLVRLEYGLYRLNMFLLIDQPDKRGFWRLAQQDSSRKELQDGGGVRSRHRYFDSDSLEANFEGVKGFPQGQDREEIGAT